MHCTAFLILGTNMGDRGHNLSSDISLLKSNDLSISAESTIYESSAWGQEDQSPFFNQALEIETTLSPLDLLDCCQKIEQKLGRIRTIKWGPRIIDIDIAFYENLIIEIDELKIPQRQLENRRFALVPLNEIAPNKHHPILMSSSQELLDACKDSLSVKSVDA